jgi:hypothetical protein
MAFNLGMTLKGRQLLRSVPAPVPEPWRQRTQALAGTTAGASA